MECLFKGEEGCMRYKILFWMLMCGAWLQSDRDDKIIVSFIHRNKENGFGGLVKNAYDAIKACERLRADARQKEAFKAACQNKNICIDRFFNALARLPEEEQGDASEVSGILLKMASASEEVVAASKPVLRHVPSATGLPGAPVAAKRVHGSSRGGPGYTEGSAHMTRKPSAGGLHSPAVAAMRPTHPKRTHGGSSGGSDEVLVKLPVGLKRDVSMPVFAPSPRGSVARPTSPRGRLPRSASVLPPLLKKPKDDPLFFVHYFEDYAERSRFNYDDPATWKVRYTKPRLAKPWRDTDVVPLESIIGRFDVVSDSLVGGLSFDDTEQCHCWVQYAFPTTTRSKFHGSAPVSNSATMEAFCSNPHLRHGLLTAFKFYLNFLGLEYDEGAQDIVPLGGGPSVVVKMRNFITHPHNFLRVTRILQSLTEHGLSMCAQAFALYMSSHFENDLAHRGIMVGAKYKESQEYWKAYRV